MDNFLLDMERYPNGKRDMPIFQIYLRKYQRSKNGFIKLFYRCLYHWAIKKSHIEISSNIEMGGGAYFGHPFCITINPNVKIGTNCNIHKGVTIGQENRGSRKGVPTIGNNVWIGINACIVGKVVIGDDVLIAPNCYVNCDIPPHSVVLGNPCIIKHKDHATEGYVNRKIDSNGGV